MDRRALIAGIGLLLAGCHKKVRQRVERGMGLIVTVTLPPYGYVPINNEYFQNNLLCGNQHCGAILIDGKWQCNVCTIVRAEAPPTSGEVKS
ncbi:MAG TPA: hypothetical protein VNH83_08725 [Bryobacteraceae bacterium]|nr:hypothetical protein [Bryobacteraceae bacterium]